MGFAATDRQLHQLPRLFTCLVGQLPDEIFIFACADCGVPPLIVSLFDGLQGLMNSLPLHDILPLRPTNMLTINSLF
jgi:hypothetical protein